MTSVDGNKYLEVADNCSETIDLRVPTSETSVVTFDLLIQDFVVVDVGGLGGEETSLRFSSSGELIVVVGGLAQAYDGLFQRGAWFTVSIETDRVEGTRRLLIDGAEVYMVIASDHIATLTFTTDQGIGSFVDNVCSGTCGDDDCITSCCPEGTCLLYTSPSPRDQRGSRMPSSA